MTIYRYMKSVICSAFAKTTASLYRCGWNKEEHFFCRHSYEVYAQRKEAPFPLQLWESHSSFVLKSFGCVGGTKNYPDTQVWNRESGKVPSDIKPQTGMFQPYKNSINRL